MIIIPGGVKVLFKKMFLMAFPISALLSFFSSQAQAAPLPRDYAIGWQFSKPASGLSLKIPIKQIYYLQPIFTLLQVEQNNQSTSHVAFGIRGIYEFQSRYDFRPYAGVALGCSNDFSATTPAGNSDNKSSTGYEAFFGVEYQKYLLRPALEIGMGNYFESDHNNYAGITFNFSLLYYF
jgi:hypothetical protein